MYQYRLSVLLILFLASSLSSGEFRGGIDRDAKILTLPFYNEPPSINSLTAGSVYTPAILLMHLQEGLLRYDQKRRLVGGVAERWDLTPTRARFWLRPNAKWSDGSKVTAHDFVFAWRELVNPRTGVSSAILASPIVNADSIIRGELPPKTLGVRAVNDYELIVDLAHPCAWFMKLMPNARFYPIKQSYYESVGRDAYGTRANASLSNGAFMVSEWQRANRIRLRKNPFYWRAAEVDLDGINYDYITSDYQALLNLYESGEIAAVYVNGQSARQAAENQHRIKIFTTGILSYLNFNHMSDRATSNLNVRKAIAYALDKEELVNRVLSMPGTRVAASMFPFWLKSGNKTFSQVHPPEKQPRDLAKASYHYRLAKQQLGLQGEITLSIMVIEDVQSRKAAEYIQASLKTSLGMEILVDVQEMKSSFDRANKGQFDIHLAGWVVDFDDPMDIVSFMGDRNVFVPPQYQQQDMIDLYLEARQVFDDGERMAKFAEIQSLIFDKTIQLPLYEGSVGYIFNPSLKGFVWHPARSLADYRHVFIEQ
jgi:oligopeptide transport system substrate-binding protein